MASARDDVLVGDRGATILVVEDEHLIRAGMSEELRNQGYTVIEAANFDEAIAVLRNSPSVEFVLTDMRMPGARDGTHLVQLIRQEFPFVRVVMVSGQTPESDVRELLDGYFSKPLAPSQLARYLGTLTRPEMVTSNQSRNCG